jgi:hypothetical protein
LNPREEGWREKQLPVIVDASTSGSLSMVFQ